MSLSLQEFTNAGKSMLGRAQNREVLTITKIVVGSGSAVQPSDLWPLTALKVKEMDVVISAKVDYGNGTMLVEGSFRSDQAPHAFYLKECGIMAHIGAEADRLYSCANVFAGAADYVDPAAATIQSFKIKLIIDRVATGDVIVQIGPSENVIGQNIGLETVGPGWYKDAAGNVLNFKRVIVGTSMDIHQVPDDVNPTAIYIGVKTLQNDLDVYVPTSYPNPPAGALLFASVQAAHDYLLGFAIPTDKFARIHVGPNRLSTAVPIVFSHPQSRQISLIGMPRVDTAVSLVTAVGVNAKNVTVASNAGLAVGQIVYLANTVPNWIGGAKITAIAGNIISLTHWRKEARLPVNIASESGGTMRLSRFPSQLINTDPNSANIPVVLSCPNGIKVIENMCFEGCGYILNIIDGNLKNSQIAGMVGTEAGARRCLNQYQGFFGLIGENVFSNAGWGIFSLGVLTAFDQTIMNGCNIGVAASGNGTAVGSITGNMPNALVYIAHCIRGIQSGGGGGFIGGSIFYCENDIGMDCTAGSTINVGAAYGSFPQNNGVDLHAQGLSYIGYNRWQQAMPTGSPSPTIEAIPPNPDIVGNQNSIIYVMNSDPTP